MPKVMLHDHLRQLAPTSLALVAGMGWDKLIVALAAVAAVVALTMTGNLDSSAAIGIISAVLGYVFGAAGVQAGVTQGADVTNNSGTPTTTPKG